MKSTIDFFRRCSVSNVDSLTVVDESANVVISARVVEPSIGGSDIVVIRLSVISIMLAVIVGVVDVESSVVDLISTVVATSLFDIGSSVNAELACEVCWATVSASASTLVLAAVVIVSSAAGTFVIGIAVVVVEGIIVVVCTASVVVCAIVSVTTVVVSVVATGIEVVLSALGAEDDGLGVVGSVGDRTSISIVSALGLSVVSSLIVAVVESAGLFSGVIAAVVGESAAIVGVDGLVVVALSVPLEGVSTGN